MEEYFEYEEIEDPDRVKFAKAKLKGHAKIWWQELQLERNTRGKGKITKWERMIAKMKRQFIPVDYELDLLKKMQGLKQAGKSIQEYTKEFYRVLIRTGHAEADKEKVVRYINGLRPSIQDELSLVRMASIKEAYQFSLRVEEKLSKKYGKKNIRRGHYGRSRRWSYGGWNDDQKNKDEASGSKN